MRTDLWQQQHTKSCPSEDGHPAGFHALLALRWVREVSGVRASRKGGVGWLRANGYEVPKCRADGSIGGGNVINERLR